ncbi:MAG: hypothetical protein IH931_07835, partial [candidate division Zixibacteria bacterium]|nr:hypothetical protein [candidate division Zixibacteria bacterium]
MKLVQNFPMLLLLVYLSTGSVGSARDLNNSGKEPLIEQTAQSFTNDIPDHLINWPLYHGLHSKGQIDATFNCFGSFGNAFSHAQFDFPLTT